MICLWEVRNIRRILPTLIAFYKQWAAAVVIPPAVAADYPCPCVACQKASRVSSVFAPLAPGPRSAAEKEAAADLCLALQSCWLLAERELERRGLGNSNRSEGLPGAEYLTSMRRRLRWLRRWYQELQVKQSDVYRQAAAATMALTLARCLELAEETIRREALAELEIGNLATDETRNKHGQDL